LQGLFFLSFYIGFIVDLKVTRGYDCNLPILNIIKQDLSARVDSACRAFKPLNATFNDGCLKDIGALDAIG